MTTETSQLTTPRAIRYRLCLMMFLQYFIQGSYLPVISAYLEDGLEFTSAQIGGFQSALALGPLLAPFIVGQIVDRMFATQWFLAACHLLGGLIMIVLYQMTGFLPILLLGAVYSALYVPTMFLTNSLAFHHLADREREFALVRLWGTIGFIVPAWCIEPFYLSHFEGDALDKARGIVLIFSGVSGLVMAAYCLTLPHTPPAKDEQKEYAPGKVLRLLGHRNFAVLVGISLIVAIVHQYFWVWNSIYLRDLLDKIGIKQAVEQRISSIGQIAEILVMLGLGFLLKRLGFKKVMLIGTLAYGHQVLHPGVGHYDSRRRSRANRRRMDQGQHDRLDDPLVVVRGPGTARVLLRLLSGGRLHLRRQGIAAGRPWQHADLFRSLCRGCGLFPRWTGGRRDWSGVQTETGCV